MSAGPVGSAVFAAAALLCLAALVRHRHGARVGAAAEANHVVMAVAMAVMAAPGGMDVVPPGVGTALFTALGACWLARLVAEGWRGRPLGSPIGHARCAAHPTHLLLVNAAMVAMYVPMLGSDDMAGMAGTAAGEHAHHGGGGSPGLAVLSAGLGIYLLVHAAATVAALVTRARAAAAAPTVVETLGAGPGAVATLAPAPARPRLEVLTAPRTQLVCQAVMGVGMAAMLLLT